MPSVIMRITCFLAGLGFVLGLGAAFLPRNIPFAIPNGLQAVEERLRFENNHPQDYFIGSSMLHRWIDVSYFGQITNRTVQYLYTPALSSLGIYLLLKNVVVKSNYTPQRVFIFFRDPELTRLSWRIDGQYRLKLWPMMFPEDVALYRVADYYNALVGNSTFIPLGLMTIVMRYDDVLRYYRQTGLTQWPGSVATRMTATISSLPREKLQSQLDQRFAMEGLRRRPESDAGIPPDTHYDFDRLQKYSLLPEMVTLAKSKSFQLCFVKVKRRIFAEGASPAPVQRRYDEALKQYLAGQGVCYIDLQNDPRIQAEFYSDGDHIAEPYFHKVTDIFLDHVKAVPNAVTQP